MNATHAQNEKLKGWVIEMYKPAGYWHHAATQAEADKLHYHPNPYPLAQFSKPVSQYLENSIRFYVEDTGNLPTASEYLDMCRSALENAVR